MAIKVKNVPNTSNLKCNCDSWLAHWEKFSGKKAGYCAIYGCKEKTDLVGGHVKRTDITDAKIYILPLCKAHNQSTQEMTVSDGYPLVSANPKETCDKAKS